MVQQKSSPYNKDFLQNSQTTELYRRHRARQRENKVLTESTEEKWRTDWRIKLSTNQSIHYYARR